MRGAWVESALQYLGAVEYAHAAGEPLAIAYREGIPQLEAAVHATVDQLPENVVEVASASSAWASSLRRAPTRLVGDANSGQYRVVAATTRVRDTVFADDGTASLALFSQLAKGEVPHRTSRRESVAARITGVPAAWTFRRLRDSGLLTICTAYERDPDLAAIELSGVRVLHHDYGWTRTLSSVEESLAGNVVVGSALVPDHLVASEPYLAWVASIGGDVTYVAHRRESDAWLARVDALDGVRVVRLKLPLELVVAASPHLVSVATLPTSVVRTLGAIGGKNVDMTVTAIPEHWYTAHASESLRAMHRAAIR